LSVFGNITKSNSSGNCFTGNVIFDTPLDKCYKDEGSVGMAADAAVFGGK